MRPLPTLACLALLLPLAGCGGNDDTTITVLAAASLTESFTALAEDFEAEHDGVTVRLAFDSSATLAEQAVGGAPADVIATADTTTMDRAADALAADPVVFATNTMVLVTPADNPAGITSYADLASGEVTYVVCVATAPCGRTATTLLEATGQRAEPASLEVDVKAVLAKVTSGEADAGLVYATDAVAAGEEVRRFEIPGAQEVVTAYPIAPLEQAMDPALAQDFVALVLSDAGRRVLRDAGFGPP
ncbi:molybdate ABC transporter substrate-binding protein [Nocardioides sp. cx-173]|uniref:molybdate ABC transporter substrate-binding protein n=1 Tax=Nocardioides sp. cx-173 TaxID=2898796 RepID=UPI001E58F1AB|nr:molybdate ABC transporter substrate-binding protein [Nocardioides sp. cx-173]MCD4525558.1 molybdate ABC transporter substrate-binding protein [Nocardioides sp. cx-173]UGB42702.1 molybdate ABC transporter substrate-binding protein [Nocardioides sp. cx-173]